MKQQNITLVDFTSVTLKAPIPQEDTVDAFAWAIAKSHCLRHSITDDATANAVLQEVRGAVGKYSVSTRFIRQRQGVFSIDPGETFPDYLMKDGVYPRVASNDQLFEGLRDHETLPEGLPIRSRMDLYDKVATAAVQRLFETEQDVPDDVVHVTCSGYVAPTPVEKLVASRKWSTTVHNCYHKGCYAFFPGLRMAAGVFGAAAQGWSVPKERVDVVHTELLSLHVKISSHAPEDLVTQTLFSDGFIKYSVVQNDITRPVHGYRLVHYHEAVIPDSGEAMTWCVGDHHFDMTLTIDVPFHLEQNVTEFVNQMFRQAGKCFETERPDLYFAIHPGGPKIVEFLQRKLELEESQVRHSFSVLSDHGNMSSATMPFLLQRVLEDDSIPDGTLVPAIGFGPGLTMSGAILEKCSS